MACCLLSDQLVCIICSSKPHIKLVIIEWVHKYIRGRRKKLDIRSKMFCIYERSKVYRVTNSVGPEREKRSFIHSVVKPGVNPEGW